MKLTFDQKIKISPIINKNKPILTDDKLYTQYNNSIVITSVLDGKILDRIEFEQISCFTVKNDLLYVANTAITVYSLTEKKLVETLAVGNILINNIEIEDSICIGCIDGSLKKIINGYAVKLTTFNSPIEQLLLRKDKIIAHDGSVVKVLYGSKVELEIQQESIKGIDFDDKLFFITQDGKVYNEQKLVLETGLNLQGLIISEDKVVLCANSSLYFYSREYKFIEKNNLIREVENEETPCDSVGEEGVPEEKESSDVDEVQQSASSQTNEDEDFCENSNSEQNEGSFVVNFVSKEIILTSVNEILLLSVDFTLKNLIVGNIDEITSIKTKEDLIIVSSSSDRLFYTYRQFYDVGEYVFKGFLLEGHSNIVMSIDLYDNKMISTSRDGTAILWLIEEILEDEVKRVKLGFKRKHSFIIKNRFECGETGLNACALADEMFVVGGDDGIIQYFNDYENILTKKIHNKEINCLLTWKEKDLIISASQDKDIKVLDYSSKVLHTLSGHRKGVISLALSSRYLASFSLDKTVRLWDTTTWECVSVLEGHDSGVLSGTFYKNNIISASILGGLKTWNLTNKKCEANLKFPNKIWALDTNQDELFVGASEYLMILKDESQKKSLEILEKETALAKQKIAIDKSLKDNDYNELLLLLKDTKDHKLLFNTISKLVVNENTLSPLKELSKQQVYKVLQNNSKFKNSETNNLIIQFLIDSRQLASKEVMKGIEKKLEKEFEAIDTIYRRFLSFDIFK